MLFDLRGRGRRRTIKFVYIALAFLMGGGLVFFGIGSDVNGGIVDAITNNSGGASDKTYEKRVEQAEAAIRRNDQDPAAWASLARARFQLAQTSDDYDSNTGAYGADAKADLQRAADAWQKHLSVAGDNPDDGLATLMVRTYLALGQAANAVAAQEIITDARPSEGTFSTLALLAYQAGQMRKGDLAAKAALEKVDKDQRNTLKSQLDQARAQAAASATPSPTATATPKKK